MNTRNLELGIWNLEFNFTELHGEFAELHGENMFLSIVNFFSVNLCASSVVLCETVSFNRLFFYSHNFKSKCCIAGICPGSINRKYIAINYPGRVFGKDCRTVGGYANCS